MIRHLLHFVAYLLTHYPIILFYIRRQEIYIILNIAAINSLGRPEASHLSLVSSKTWFMISMITHVIKIVVSHDHGGTALKYNVRGDLPDNIELIAWPSIEAVE